MPRLSPGSSCATWAICLILGIVAGCGAGAPATAPRGKVHGRGAAFADDRGPFLPLGATLFWGPWGYKFDRARLERHLEFLASRGVDYVRVLGQVGSPGNDPEDTWGDRPIDPRWSDACRPASNPTRHCGTYDEVIAGLTDLAYDRYALRVEWTVFGGVGFTPTPESRLALIDRMIAMSKGREHKIMHFEVANEFYHNGFPGSDGLNELRRLGRHLQDRTSVLVALSAPRGSECAVMQQMHASGTGDVVTEHFDRSGEDSGWAAVRASWDLQFCKGLPPLRSSNEPIGPFSSVRPEGDPLRLAMAAAVAYLSGVGSYVLHSGPGIRGGGRADVERGRPADIWSVPKIDRIFEALANVRRALPADLPNWSRHEARPGDPITLRAGGSAPVTAYTATQGKRFVVLPLNVQEPLTVEARVPLTLKIVEPMTGAVLHQGALDAAARATVAKSAAYVITGETAS